MGSGKKRGEMAFREVDSPRGDGFREEWKYAIFSQKFSAAFGG
jgi:hypothetical protein